MSTWRQFLLTILAQPLKAHRKPFVVPELTRRFAEALGALFVRSTQCHNIFESRTGKTSGNTLLEQPKNSRNISFGGTPPPLAFGGVAPPATVELGHLRHLSGAALLQMLVYAANDALGVARHRAVARHVLVDEGVRADHNVVPNGDAFENRGVHPDEDVATDLDAPGRAKYVTVFALEHRPVVAVSQDGGAFGYGNVVANLNHPGTCYINHAVRWRIYYAILSNYHSKGAQVRNIR